MRKVQHLHNGRTSVNRLPLTKQDILSHYSSCFEGIGCFPGEPYKFHLKPEHKPSRYAPRKVPIHLEDAFKEEIKSLVELGILEEVKEHTNWVNSSVIVEKDSGNHQSPNHTIKRKLRICLDPRDLNEALEREPHHTCSVNEVTTKLQAMTVFTIVDFKKGYWMVVLHPESRKLTCIVLPFGRFQWTRLPMGTVVAQDIFQSKLDSIFIGKEGVTGIADDIDLHEFWLHKEMLSTKSGLITCGNRIIVPKEMQPEMLQYIHEGQEGKERCLLRDKKYSILAQDNLRHSTAHREVYDLPGVWKISAAHRDKPKNYLYFHGTHWQQIYSTGKGWTS